MKVEVLDITGKVVQDIELKQNIWQVVPHQQAMYDVVLCQQASWRQGTHKTKTRGEVSGGGKKPWRQKKTGRARHGSIRSPIWRGGGTVFGVTPERNYKLQVNRKVHRLALKSALSLKTQANQIIVLDDFIVEKPSTKNIINILTALNIQAQKILIVTKEVDDNLWKSVRNLKNKIVLLPATSVNVYDLLHCDKLVITKAAINLIEEGFN